MIVLWCGYESWNMDELVIIVCEMWIPGWILVGDDGNEQFCEMWILVG